MSNCITFRTYVLLSSKRWLKVGDCEGVRGLKLSKRSFHKRINSNCCSIGVESVTLLSFEHFMAWRRRVFHFKLLQYWYTFFQGQKPNPLFAFAGTPGHFSGH